MEQMTYPTSRYANRFKKQNKMVKQNYHRGNSDNSHIFTELSYTEHLKQEHNSSSLSVTTAKFASKEGPKLKMPYTRRHMSQTPLPHESA